MKHSQSSEEMEGVITSHPLPEDPYHLECTPDKPCADCIAKNSEEVCPHCEGKGTVEVYHSFERDGQDLSVYEDEPCICQKK